MENQRLEECWPGRRRWKGEAFVPCTRAWPGVREIPERDRVQRAARQRWDGLRGEGIPPAPGLRCREAGVAPWWLPPAAGDGLGAPPAGPPCAIIPLGAVLPRGLRLCLPGAVGPRTGPDGERGRVPAVPCHGALLPWPGPSGSRAREGWATGLCPSVGPESILPGHSLPAGPLLLWGQRGVAGWVWGGKGGGPLGSPPAAPWGRVGTGGDAAPGPRLAARTRVRPFPVRVTGRGVAGGARREEAGGHELFLPGSLCRDHLGLPGATGCRDTVAVLVPSCGATGAGLGRSAGGPAVAEGRSEVPLHILVSRSPRHFCHL